MGINKLSVLGAVASIIGVALSVISIAYDFINVWIFVGFLIFSVSITIINYSIYVKWSNLKRLFRNNWKKGPNGELYLNDVRHIVLRTKTIQQVISGYKGISNDNYHKLLKGISIDIGIEFGEILIQDCIGQSKYFMDDYSFDRTIWKQKMEEWVNYDEDMGFGKFKLEDFENSISDNIGSLIIDNFLSFDEQSKETICIFLSGYIEGVLNRLLPISTDVRLKEMSEDNRTVFLIKRAA